MIKSPAFRLSLALSLAFALQLGAQQQAPQFSYSRVLELNSSSKIELQNIEDFARIAREARIRDIFYTDQYFAYSLNSSLYQFKSNGYASIDDYLAGQKAKLPSGRLFYLAQGNKLKSAEEVQYFDKEYFNSGDDYRKALALGFVGKAEAEKVKKFYGLTTKADLLSDLRSLAWLCYVLSPEGRGADAKAFNPQPDPEKVADWSKGAFKKVAGDVYLMDVSVEDKSRATLSGKDAEAAKKPIFKSDAVLYYLARLARYDGYDQFSKRNLQLRANVVGSDRILEGMKMASIEELGLAAAAGYANGDEYRLGKFYELKGKAEFDRHKAFIARLEEQRSSYGLKTRDQAALALILKGIQAGIPVSTDVFVEKANAELIGNAEFAAMRFKKTSSKGVEALFALSPKLTVEYGYAADEKVIQRKAPPAAPYPPAK